MSTTLKEEIKIRIPLSGLVKPGSIQLTSARILRLYKVSKPEMEVQCFHPHQLPGCPQKQMTHYTVTLKMG